MLCTVAVIPGFRSWIQTQNSHPGSQLTEFESGDEFLLRILGHKDFHWLAPVTVSRGALAGTLIMQVIE